MSEDPYKLAKDTKEESSELQRTIELDGEHIIKTIVHLASFGISQREISKQLKITIKRIKTILASHTVREEIYRIQQELYERDAKKMFMRLLPEAAAVTYKLLKSKKSKEMTKLAAANMVMDRALGKPTQHVVEEKSELKEVFVRMNEKLHSTKRQNNSETIIESTCTPVEEVKDSLDKALEGL